MAIDDARPCSAPSRPPSVLSLIMRYDVGRDLAVNVGRGVKVNLGLKSRPLPR